jgi:hypothetical protein
MFSSDIFRSTAFMVKMYKTRKSIYSNACHREFLLIIYIISLLLGLLVLVRVCLPASYKSQFFNISITNAYADVLKKKISLLYKPFLSIQFLLIQI